MSQTYKYLIVDCSNLYRRNYSIQIKKLTGSDISKIYNKTIEATLRSINKLEREYLSENGTIYFSFDNPTSRISLRAEYSKKYKANRVKMPDEYYKSLDNLAYILLNRSDKYKVIRVPFLEADDHLKPLVEHLLEVDRISYTLVCSADLDWAKEIRKNVHWFNFNEIVDLARFKELKGYDLTRESITLYKTLKGDKADGIDNIMKNIPEDVLFHVISNYKNAISLLTNISKDEKVPDKWKSRFKEASAEIRMNYMLVDYIPCDYSDLNEYMVKGKLNIDIFHINYIKKRLNIK